MSTISAYPTPSVGGPVINRLIDLPVEYKTIRYEFDDGGLDVNVIPCGLKRWELQYEGLTSTEAQTLLDHFNLAKGKTNNFSFFHHRDGVTYTGVRYEDFVVERHIKFWSLPRRVVLAALF